MYKCTLMRRVSFKIIAFGIRNGWFKKTWNQYVVKTTFVQLSSFYGLDFEKGSVLVNTVL